MASMRPLSRSSHRHSWRQRHVSRSGAPTAPPHHGSHRDGSPTEAQLAAVGAQRCSTCQSNIITWHATHCCRLCEVKPDFHGPQCDRLTARHLRLDVVPNSSHYYAGSRHLLSIPEFAALVARALGPTRDATTGEWVHTNSDRAPLSLDFLRGTSPPSPLGKSSVLAITDAIDCSSLKDPYDGTPALPHAVFLESTGERTLPTEFLPGDPKVSERLFWRLVCTDQCEAVHMGVALAVRILWDNLTLMDEGTPIVDFGLVSADRTAPFARHIPLMKVDCDAAPSSDGRTKLWTRTPPPGPAKPGGCAHRVLWLRTADGRQKLADFTGAQFGIDERLPATATPFWSAGVELLVSRVSCYGLTPRPNAVSFIGVSLPLGIFDSRPQMVAALRVRDRILRVLADVGVVPPANSMASSS